MDNLQKSQVHKDRGMSHPVNTKVEASAERTRQHAIFVRVFAN